MVLYVCYEQVFHISPFLFKPQHFFGIVLFCLVFTYSRATSNFVASVIQTQADLHGIFLMSYSLNNAFFKFVDYQSTKAMTLLDA